MAEADAGRPVYDLVEAAAEHGIAAALASAELLDEQKPARSQALYQVIGRAANSRRLPAELLRLYTPEAYQLFYTSEGEALQRRLAQGLSWKVWPAALPEAVVRAAPAPTLDWLRGEAKSQAPALEKLHLLLPALAWWLRAEREREVAPQYRTVLGALTSNEAIVADEPTVRLLLHTLAAAQAADSLDFVLRRLHAGSAETRGAAVEAAGQMLSVVTPSIDAEHARALPAFLQIAHEETDAAVLAKVATAAEAWSDDSRVGQAMLEMFTRVPDGAMQRNILFAVGKTHWPQRAQIIQLGLEATGHGVTGVALEAVAAHPLPELAPATLAMLAAQKEPQPLLIDAAGALGDPRALPTLLRWLGRERNPALLLKLALALENIPGETGDRALSDLLNHSVEPLVVDALCRIASRRELKGATEILVSLSEDATAPLEIRSRAVWALGRYSDASARECLARLRRDPEKYFPSEGRTLLPEAVEQARLSITLAGLRQGDAGMEQEVTRLFDAGTPALRLACLTALAEIRRDHPVIETALHSPDFAVLLGGVKAARAAAPAKYLPRLRELQASPAIVSLSTSGLDVWHFPELLADAIRAGQVRAAQP